MAKEFSKMWLGLLQAGLEEDGSPWDWTSLGIEKPSKLQAKVIAKSHGIWAAKSLVDSVNQTMDECKLTSRLQDGEKFQQGTVLVNLLGDPSQLLALERPFLNLAAYVCGISTATARLVQKVRNVCPDHPPRITLTRKTLPYYRDLAIHAVRIGGGFPHRVNLAGGVLIKENHIAGAGGIPKAIQAAKRVAPHGLKIEVEVTNLKELSVALESGAEGVLLDNFSPDQVKKALKVLSKCRNRPFVEVSGGLNEANIESYALEGVDVLSVGSLTHSVQAADLSLLVHGRD